MSRLTDKISRLAEPVVEKEGCRLWDVETNKKMDKDRFRRDLGDVEETYQEVFERIEK